MALGFLTTLKENDKMAGNDPLKEQFDILRKRAKQGAATATQAEQEGLQRRFAQIGQVGSGSQIRAEAQASERGAQRLAQAEETVGLAELGEKQRLKETDEARKFATSERLGSQEFGANQADIQRKYGTSERLGSQAFGSEQADIQRKFMQGERLSAQDFASLEAEAGRKFSQEERIAAQDFADEQGKITRQFQEVENTLNRALQQAGLDFQVTAFNENTRQVDRQFEEDVRVTNINAAMADRESKKSLLDDLGLGGKPSLDSIARSWNIKPKKW